MGVQLKKEDQNKQFISKLITQGLLMLLETEVQIRCREADVKLVESCLSGAADEYAKTIKSETAQARSCKLAVDKSKFLAPAAGSKEGASCLGGVVLACADGKITIDNT